MVRKFFVFGTSIFIEPLRNGRPPPPIPANNRLVGNPALVAAGVSPGAAQPADAQVFGRSNGGPTRSSPGHLGSLDNANACLGATDTFSWGPLAPYTAEARPAGPAPTITKSRTCVSSTASLKPRQLAISRFVGLRSTVSPRQITTGVSATETRKGARRLCTSA